MEIIDVLRSVRAAQSAARTPDDTELQDFRADARRAVLTESGRASLDIALHAVSCGLFNLAIVAAWAILIDQLHDAAWNDGFASTAAYLPNKKAPKTREAVRDLRDFDFLAALQQAGFLGSARHKSIQGLLNDRNHASHVGSSKTTRRFSLGYIERILVQCDECHELEFSTG